MPHITLSNGLSMYYERCGSGPDLALISGLSADHSVWSLVLDTLARRYRVLTFDNRGVGQSDAPTGPYTLAMMATDTVTLMDALNIPHAAMVGHSMGGAILQKLCITHPTRVTKAVVCASAARIPDASMWHVNSVANLLAADVTPGLVFDTALPWIFGGAFLCDDAKVATALGNLLNNPHPQSLEAFRAQISACETDDLRPQLKDIATATLIMAGREDLLTPLRCSEELQRGIRNARLAVVEDCGHMIQLEYPNRFCEIVTEFLT